MEHLKHVFSGAMFLIQAYQDTELSPYSNIQHVWAHRDYDELPFNKVDDKLEVIIASNVANGRLPVHISGRLAPLDDNLPQKNTGELIIAGDQLMAGYLNDEQRTRDAFLQVDGISYYKTGDFFRKDGDVFYFLDRADSLVKVKGYRVNLSDITDLLCGYDSVADARVVAVLDAESDQQVLVAFFVSNSGLEIDDVATHLLRLCEQNLPAYMVPSKFLQISTFPLGKTGKHDLSKLRQQA